MTASDRIRDTVDRLATGRQRLIGLSLIRIGFGANVALIYLANLPYRDVLYGPRGQTDFASFSASQHASGSIFSLYSFSDGDIWFNLVYFSGLVAALAWMTYGGRALTLVNAIFLWSLDQRNPDVLDGGDNLARILVLLLVFATTNAYLSPVAGRVRARLAGAHAEATLVASMHNMATVLIIFQICVVYAIASFWKIVDTRWREGNALYYISQLRQFQYTDVIPALMHNAAIVTFFSYLTIVVQSSVVLLVISQRRWLRELTLLLVVGMHVGIMVAMGLVSFGLFMIAADAMLLSDDDYRVGVAWITTRGARLAALRRAGRPLVTPGADPDTMTSESPAAPRSPAAAASRTAVEQSDSFKPTPA
jgi:hypothetical protein